MISLNPLLPLTRDPCHSVKEALVLWSAQLDFLRQWIGTGVSPGSLEIMRFARKVLCFRLLFRWIDGNQAVTTPRGAT